MRVKSAKGFNLVETVVTIFIIAIISTIAASTFSKYRKKINFRNAARVIAADYAYVKQKAVAESVHYKIILNTESNCYKIIKGGISGNVSEYDEASAITKKLTSFDSDIVFSASSPPNYPYAQIIFQPRGTISAGSLFLEDSDGSKAKITSNLMGRVRISFE
jgi:prepilin-type N-terminal cleavage/methylation domain-containing protein